MAYCKHSEDLRELADILEGEADMNGLVFANNRAASKAIRVLLQEFTKVAGAHLVEQCLDARQSDLETRP